MLSGHALVVVVVFQPESAAWTRCLSEVAMRGMSSVRGQTASGRQWPKRLARHLQIGAVSMKLRLLFT